MKDHSTFYKQVGEKIRSRRGKKLSQEALASAVGLTRTSISNIEKGRQRLLLHTLVDVADALQVEAASLLPDRLVAPEPVGAETLARLSVTERVFIESAIGLKQQKENHGHQERKIRELVQTLLTEAKVTEAPVPVWEIARKRGARIVVESLDGDLSGFLYRDSSQKIIGVNTQHASVRQNFTVAHELAHLLLHDQEQLHLDRAFSTVRLRDDVSSQGVDGDEIEANLFAAEILMPESFLRRDLSGQRTLDLYEEDLIPELARKYGVSVQALMFRLQYLGYIEG